jgi:ABC-type amino acid transport substrate-binding protein
LLIFFSLLSHHGWALELKTMAQDSEPKYLPVTYADGSTGVEGLCIEILKAIERIDPEIKIQVKMGIVPFKRIEVELEGGGIDLFFGMIRNEEREKKFIFLEPPLYATSNKLVVNANDTIQVNSWDDVRSLGAQGIILVDFGTAHVKYLEEQGGLLVESGGKTREDNLQKLMLRRGRFYYSTDLGIVHVIRTQGLEGKFRLLPRVFKEDFQYLAVSRKAPVTAPGRLAAALKKLAESGELQKIRAKY